MREGKVKEAWDLTEMGLLASRYACLFTESISLASFHSEHTDSDTQNANIENSEHTNSDTHNANKIIDTEELRQAFVENYKAKNSSQVTHPIMCKFNSPSCDTDENVENAKVASVSSMHHCITNACGGDKKTGAGCRFSFHKRNNYALHRSRNNASYFRSNGGTYVSKMNM